MSETPILQLRGISKSFGSVQALTDVDFEVRLGEVMALVGDNGAGKSTLVKCVAGTHSPDGGEILFEGKPVHIHSPKDASRLGIQVVYQDLALADNLDVVQNMFLGREERDWLWRLKEPAMEQRTAETLRSLSVTTIRSIRQPVASLSGQDATVQGVQNIISGWQTMTVYKYVPDEANAAAKAAVALLKHKKVPGVNGFRKNGSKKEPTVQIPVVSITKKNYTRLFKDKFLKKSDVCVGEFAQFCS